MRVKDNVPEAYGNSEPTDMNYGSIFPDKNDQNNIKKAAKNIQTRFGLDEKGIEPKGGD